MSGEALRGLRAVRLRHGPPLPAGFRHLQVEMPPAPGVDRQAVVVDLARAEDHRLVLAAVARHWWSADHGQLDTCTASAAELDAQGQAFLDVGRLGLVDPALLTEPGCPLRPPDPGRRHTWVRAERLGAAPTRGWVPYSLALPLSYETRPGEPRTHPPLLAGLGAGTGVCQATARAWEALRVEDALWLWWSDPWRTPPEPVEPDPEAARLWEAEGLEVRLAALPDSLGGKVALALVDDGRVAAVGGGPGTGRRGQREAVARALWQLVVARALSDPHDALHRTSAHALVPFRPEGDYLRCAGPRRRRLLDPLGHVQLLLDPVVREEVLRRAEPRSAAGRPSTAAQARRAVGAGGQGAAAGRPGEAGPGGEGGDGAVPEPEDLPLGEAWVIRLGPPADQDLTDESMACVRLLVPGASSLPLGAFPPHPHVAASARLRLRRRAEAEAVPFPGATDPPGAGPRSRPGPGQGGEPLPFPGW
ncbi:YcaO-like family protein [Actinomyces howellii]|uniref:Bacteriocin biosynthesis docking scaffold, SagD family n=1 Tax=Actinomyces howellii TaxID=52771 RepID=A0A3S4V5D5_9ACTO|nr:YcaO-like family protein [Actinomyces howellii]VEG28966.1 bacteriocin biosynthesis docking scaffold, SagD family [Actinomyces howellii]